MAPLKILKDWLAKNWLTLIMSLAAIAVAIWLIFSMFKAMDANSSLQKLMQNQQERHVQEIAELNQSFERQRTAQAEIDRQFEQRIQELDARYLEALGQIAQTRRTRQARLEENPSELSGVYEQVFGIPSASQRSDQQ